MAPRELARLYDAHASALFAFLLALTRDESGTRDLLQDLFLRLARRQESWAEIREERAYLLRLAHNLVVDASRRGAVRRRVQTGLAAEAGELFEAPPAGSGEDPEVGRQVAAALAELPQEQCAVVQLKLWEGLTFDQIARVLEIPPNTAASRYRYALEKLRSRLRPLYLETRERP